MPKCMITGCDLKIEDSFIHGDLWEDGNVWIFNAVGNPKAAPSHSAANVIEIFHDGHHNYFERRNVFVFQKLHSTLNDHAYNYLNKHEDEKY